MPPLSRVSARAVRHRSVPRPPRHTRKANNGTVAELPSSPSRTAALPAARARSGPQPKRSRSTRRADAEAERKRRRFPRSPAPPGPAGPSHGARRDPRCPTGRSQGGAGKVPRAPLSRHLSRSAEPSPKLTEALSRRGERRRCSDRGWGARATVTSRLAAAPRSFPRVLPARHGTARHGHPLAADSPLRGAGPPAAVPSAPPAPRAHCSGRPLAPCPRAARRRGDTREPRCSRTAPPGRTANKSGAATGSPPAHPAMVWKRGPPGPPSAGGGGGLSAAWPGVPRVSAPRGEGATRPHSPARARRRRPPREPLPAAAAGRPPLRARRHQ